MPALPARLSIGLLAARSGLAPSALRYYEEAGLLRPQRSPSGHRSYERSDLRRVAFVQAAQAMGLSLAEIRATLARLPRSRTPTREDWERVSRAWKERVDARLAELQRLRATLDGCIGCGCLSLDRCPLYNDGDRLATTGAGARLLIDPALLPRRPR
jgi:MerR family redox-sensitive transcriptional activator SoxR